MQIQDLAREKVSPEEVKDIPTSEELKKWSKQSPLVEEYMTALKEDNFEKAQQLYQQMSASEREQAKETSKQYHSAVIKEKIIKFANLLHKKGFIKEADILKRLL